jgi:iron complex outermembrane recepter protein
VQWIAGLYFSSDSIDVLQRLQGDAFLPLLTGIPAPIAAWQDYSQDTKSYAAFANVEWPVSSRVTLVAGVRGTHEKKDFSGGTTFVTGLLGNIPLTFTDDSIDVDDLSGKVGINFKPNDDLLLYVSGSKGFKSGGFNAAFASDPVQLEPFKPEKLWAVEAGWKATLLDGAMTFNGAAYYYDWRDFQAQIVTVRGGIPVQILSNAGDAEVIGVEADWTWRAANGLEFNLAANYNDTKVTTGQLKGSKLANTPDFAVSGYGRYSHTLANTSMKVVGQVDFNYRTKVDFRLNAVTKLGDQAAYGLLNARLGLGTQDDRTSLTLFVQNLTNKKYLVDAFEQLPINILHVWGRPRTWGVTIDHKFF